MTTPVLDVGYLVDDLRVVLGLADIDVAKAALLLDLAAQRVASVISPVPVQARPIVLDVAARAYANPVGVAQESVGPFTRSFTSSGLYLTKRERADLRRMRGAGGAFTINPVAPVPVVVVPVDPEPDPVTPPAASVLVREVLVPDVFGAGDNAVIVAQAPFTGTISKVEFVPLSPVTGAATNNRTLSLVNKGQSGSGSVVVASLTFGVGVTAAGNNETALTLSATAADRGVVEGDTLLWRSIHNGTGLADPGGLVRVTFLSN